MNWISVKDKLPEPSNPLEIKRVLVWMPSFGEEWKVGWMFQFPQKGNVWRIEGSPSDWPITHWFPVQPPSP